VAAGLRIGDEHLRPIDIHPVFGHGALSEEVALRAGVFDVRRPIAA
jgi:hypothetical protein